MVRRGELTRCSLGPGGAASPARCARAPARCTRQRCRRFPRTPRLSFVAWLDAAALSQSSERPAVPPGSRQCSAARPTWAAALLAAPGQPWRWLQPSCCSLRARERWDAPCRCADGGRRDQAAAPVLRTARRAAGRLAPAAACLLLVCKHVLITPRRRRMRWRARRRPPLRPKRMRLPLALLGRASLWMPEPACTNRTRRACKKRPATPSKSLTLIAPPARSVILSSSGTIMALLTQPPESVSWPSS